MDECKIDCKERESCHITMYRNSIQDYHNVPFCYGLKDPDLSVIATTDQASSPRPRPLCSEHLLTQVSFQSREESCMFTLLLAPALPYTR